MGDIAIRVQNLCKLYRIRTREARYKTIRESLTAAVAAPLRRLLGNSRVTIQDSRLTNPDSAFRIHLGSQGRLFRGQTRRGHRFHRSQWGGQVNCAGALWAIVQPAFTMIMFLIILRASGHRAMGDAAAQRAVTIG